MPLVNIAGFAAPQCRALLAQPCSYHLGFDYNR